MLTLAELPAEADAYPPLARRVKKEKLYEKKGPRAFAKRSAFESFDDYLDKTYRLRRKNMQGFRRLRKRLAFTRHRLQRWHRPWRQHLKTLPGTSSARYRRRWRLQRQKQKVNF